jgi:hypothetical protein
MVVTEDDCSIRSSRSFVDKSLTVALAYCGQNPAVKDGTPAATSRRYAIAAQQIVNANIYTPIQQ